MRLAIQAIMALAAVITPATAQVPDLRDLVPGDGSAISARVIQYVLLITVLSVAPALLIMATSFTRLIIAFSFLRSGLGLQSTPANLVLITLALFLTGFIMTPVLDKSWQEGLMPSLRHRSPKGKIPLPHLRPSRAGLGSLHPLLHRSFTPWLNLLS